MDVSKVLRAPESDIEGREPLTLDQAEALCYLGSTIVCAGRYGPFACKHPGLLKFIARYDTEVRFYEELSTNTLTN